MDTSCVEIGRMSEREKEGSHLGTVLIYENEISS